MHEAKEAVRETAERRPVCKSLWMASCLNLTNLWPYVNLRLCLLGLIAYLLSQKTTSKSLCKRRLLSCARGTERTVVPVYQLSENLHFNWILMFEPNYTCWVTGAPSEKELTDLKCESTEDDSQSDPFTLTMQNSTSCAKIAHAAIIRNILGLCV